VLVFRPLRIARYTSFFKHNGIGDFSSLRCNQTLIIVVKQMTADVKTKSIKKQARTDIGSQVLGKASAVKVKKTDNANRHVMEYPTRSPLSVGRMKTAEFKKRSIITGVNIVRIKYDDLLSMPIVYFNSANVNVVF
jgi:hypothetical protein